MLYYNCDDHGRLANSQLRKNPESGGILTHYRGDLLRRSNQLSYRLFIEDAAGQRLIEGQIPSIVNTGYDRCDCRFLSANTDGNT